MDVTVTAGYGWHPRQRIPRRMGWARYAWPRAVAVGAVSLLILVTSASAFGSDIAIRRDGCRSGVHLAAHDAHLSRVLGSLAKALDFRLVFESDSDPIVNIDEFLHAEDMVPRLAERENFIVAQAPEPTCALSPRIVGVWVLPKSRTHPSTLVSPASAKGPAGELSEQDRRAQEGVNMYLKAHGFSVPESKPAP
jgi:hypothetical protein